METNSSAKVDYINMQIAGFLHKPPVPARPTHRPNTSYTNRSLAGPLEQMSYLCLWFGVLVVLYICRDTLDLVMPTVAHAVSHAGVNTRMCVRTVYASV